MKQMVYVVLDNGEVVGVYDHYTDAEDVATETATITPVIVGKTDDCRVGCETPEEVIEAMEHELSSAPSYPDSYPDSDSDSYDEDEDEDEDEVDAFGVPTDYDSDFDDDDDDEWDEEEEESDPIESMIYDMDGKRVISKENAKMLAMMIRNIVYADSRIPVDKKTEVATQLLLDFAKEKGIWGVDMR